MSSDTPTPLVAVLRHNFKQRFSAWRVQGDAADKIEQLTRELASSESIRRAEKEILLREIEEHTKLKTEVERLREALKFYADAGSYCCLFVAPGQDDRCPVLQDDGVKARSALAVRGKGREQENAGHQILSEAK